MEAVYLDHAATTPLDPRVRDAMKAAGDGIYANPSSMHLPGRKARDLVDRARHQVAELLNAKDDEIVFTSSGTEADRNTKSLNRTGSPSLCTGRGLGGEVSYPLKLAA